MTAERDQGVTDLYCLRAACAGRILVLVASSWPMVLRDLQREVRGAP